MEFVIFILGFLLDIVLGGAMPQITPAPLLDRRQYQGVRNIWSPVLTDFTSTSWERFSYGASYTISTSGSVWAWCPSLIGCGYFYTGCQSGTLFGATPFVCSATQPLCGTEYLASTLGASVSLARPACFPSGVTVAGKYLLVSPTNSPTSTTSSSTGSSTSSSVSSSSSAPPVPISHQSKPVGAIVGGVVGGLAVISIAAILIWLLSSQRKAQFAGTEPHIGQPELVQMPQNPQNTPPYDPKHTSYTSSYPFASNSPQPWYQNAENEAFDNSIPPNQPSNTQVFPNPAAVPSRAFSPSAMPAALYQQQYSNTQTPGLAHPFEMPTFAVGLLLGHVELNANQAHP